MVKPVQKISSGSSFEAVAGYSRAVIDEPTIHVASATGFDYSTMAIVADAVTQTHQAFANVAAALAAAGGSLADGVRVRYYLTDGSLLGDLAPVFGQYFGEVRPAATAIIGGRVDRRMKIEIEVTARRPA